MITITIPIIALVGVVWFLLSAFCVFKQTQTSDIDESSVLIISMLGPLWFVGAIIRQVIINKWK